MRQPWYEDTGLGDIDSELIVAAAHFFEMHEQKGERIGKSDGVVGRHADGMIGKGSDGLDGFFLLKGVAIGYLKVGGVEVVLGFNLFYSHYYYTLGATISARYLSALNRRAKKWENCRKFKKMGLNW